jgi:trans-2,3-dihydro-3-hydroxyanthranilate isomerase
VLPASLSYDVVDVFTDRPYAGNPLAVVHGAGALPSEGAAGDRA